jgi:CO/xanthine dehydrogenase Mo-binding subunit
VRGKGVAVILKSTPTPSRTECRVRLGSDGRVTVYSSAVEMGQGSTSTIAQLAADHLGVGYADVHVELPDTDVTPFDSMSAGSRLTFSMDHAIRDAVARLGAVLVGWVREQAAGPSGELRFDAGAVCGDAGDPVRFDAVLRAAGRTELTELGVFQSAGGEALKNPMDVQGHSSVHWHQGAVSAEVEVDTETGRVEVVRYHGASWAGRVVSPSRGRQQNDGSMIMGMGPALYEELQLVDGQVVNPNLSDYMIPSILDVPVDLTSSALVSTDPGAELHGVGELTIPAAAPAIANAVYQATGARITTLPLTAERVLRAIRALDAQHPAQNDEE